jgi:hypothetical protein
MWTKVNFGKHFGKTLPQVILSDPNYFFWAANILYGPLATEAKILERRARNIEIQKPKPKLWEVEYRWDRDNRFLGIGIVKADSHVHPLFGRLPHLDLAYIRRGNVHDQRDGRKLICDFRNIYCAGLNLTKQRCEAFFEDEQNFTKAGW